MIRKMQDICTLKTFSKTGSHSRNFRNVTVVGADSSQPDLDEGHLGRENYGWIKEAFSGENFKVFALHHHLVPIPLAGRENTVLVDAGDVLDLLNRCKVNLVLCGHCHIPLGLEPEQYACGKCRYILFFQNQGKNHAML